jgi:beta-phosphoglucomutase family hydrolase
MEPTPPFAAIFDWDGVIVDSSQAHERAWERLAQIEGRSLPAGFFKKSFGMKNEKVIADLLEWTSRPGELQELSLRKEEFFRAIVRQDGIAPLPGVLSWLVALKSADIPCAVGSSTLRQNVDCVIDALGVRAFFRAIVSAEDVMHGKPNPEVFLLAARRLEILTSRCVVFEDAHVGIEAALAAGMTVIAVASTHPTETLRRAHRVVQRMDELTVSELSSWLKGHQAASR